MTSPTLDDRLLREARAHASAGAWQEVVAVLRDALVPLAERPERATLYAEALLRVGEPRRASEFLQEALPVLARGPHRRAHRTGLNLFGAASFAIGELDVAESAWDVVLELAQRAGDSLLAGRAMNNLGAVASLRGDAHRAVALYQLAVPIFQRLGDLHRLAETFHNLAILHRDLDDLVAADEHERRSIEYAREAGADRMVALARAGRAELALRRGDNQLAAASALAAVRAGEALGDRKTQADAWRCAGEANAALGRHAEARRLLDEAMRFAEGSGEALMVAESLLASARLSAAVGDRARAASDAGHALERFRRLGARTSAARAEALQEDLLSG